jgi:hypothetical protein
VAAPYGTTGAQSGSQHGDPSVLGDAAGREPGQRLRLEREQRSIGTTLDNTTWNQFRAGFNGVLYLSAGYASGERLGRIQRLFSSALGGLDTLSVQESLAIQANNQLLDAEILSPHLLTAFANGTAPGADPQLAALAADPSVARPSDA